MEFVFTDSKLDYHITCIAVELINQKRSWHQRKLPYTLVYQADSDIYLAQFEYSSVD